MGVAQQARPPIAAVPSRQGAGGRRKGGAKGGRAGGKGYKTKPTITRLKASTFSFQRLVFARSRSSNPRASTSAQGVGAAFLPAFLARGHRQKRKTTHCAVAEPPFVGGLGKTTSAANRKCVDRLPAGES